MAMVFFAETGRLAFEGRSTPAFPDFQPHVIPARRMPDERVIDDLTTQRAAPSGAEDDPTDRLLAAGYRSLSHTVAGHR